MDKGQRTTIEGYRGDVVYSNIFYAPKVFTNVFGPKNSPTLTYLCKVVAILIRISGLHIF